MTNRLGRVAGCLALAFATARCADKIVAPVANAGSAVTANMGSSVVLDGRSSTDPQGRLLAYDWSFATRPAQSRASFNDPRISTPSFVPDLDGVYMVELIVSNGVLSSPASQVQVTVRKCGQAAPDIATATASPANPNKGNVVQLSATVHDADNDAACGLGQTFTLVWTSVSLPAAITDPTAATTTFTPDQIGTYQFSVVATDSTGLQSAPKFVTVNTTKCGSAIPSIDSITALPTNPNLGDVVTLSEAVTDADNTAGCSLAQTFSYDWRVVSRPAGSSATLSNPSVASPTIAPDAIGTYQLVLTVTDSTGNVSNTAHVQFSTTACGSAVPTITSTVAAPATPNIGTAVHLTAVVDDTDNGPTCHRGQTLTTRWALVSRPASSSAFLDDHASASPSFTPDAVGTYQFSVTVSDGTGNTSPPSFVGVSTTACGTHAPAAIIDAGPTSPVPGMSVTLTATVTDADNAGTCQLNQAFTYAWSLTRPPSSATALLFNPADASPSFTPDVAGFYRASLTVTDSAGLSSQVAVKDIFARPCGATAVSFSTPPFASTTFTDPEDPASAGPHIAGHPNVGSPVTVTVSAVNPGVACGFVSGTVRYVWTLASPSGSSVLGSAPSPGVQFTFTPDVVGTYDLSVKAVDDAGGQSASVSTSVSTTDCGAAPISVAVAAPKTTVNSFEKLTFTATAAPTTCPARFAPQIAWALAGVGAPAQLSASLGGTMDFRSTGPGDYVVSAVAINTTGHEGPVGAASVHVDACGSRAPVITTLGNSPAFPARLQTIVLTADAADPDEVDVSCNAGRAWSPAFELLSAPQGAGFTFQPGSTSFVAQVEGTYSFRVVAIEAGTGLRSDAAVLNVTVLDPSPTASSVVASPATVAVGGPTELAAERATVTVTVRNRLGQPIGDLPVSVVSSGSGNTFRTPATGPTDHNTGVFVTTVSSTEAETKTFTATANPGAAAVILSEQPSVTFVPGPAASFTVAVSTNPITAGVADSFAVTALDRFNNIATGYVGIADFSSTDTAAEFTPASHTFTSGTGPNNGLFNAGSVKFHAAGSQTVTATDHNDATVTGTSAAVTVEPGDATRFKVVVSTSPVIAGVADVFTVTAFDQFDNIATGYVGTADFSSSDTAAEFTPASHTFTSGAGLNNGVFNTGSVKFHAAGSQTVTADDGTNHVTGTSAAVTVNPAAPDTAVFSVQPAAFTTTGHIISPAVKVTVKDRFLNIVPGASVALAIGNNPAGGVLSGGSPQLTNTLGVATFAALSIDKAGSGYTLRATVASTPSDVVVESNLFNIVDPAIITTFIAQPANIFAGGATQLTYAFSGGTGSIDPGPLSAPASGSQVVLNIAGTTTYTLKVTNAAGTETPATAMVTVTSSTGWLDQNNGTTDPVDTHTAQPFSMTFDPADSSIIYAATLTKGVLSSTGGPPWSQTGFPAGTPVYGVTAGRPGGNLSVWASIDRAGKLYHFTDALGWTEVTGGGLPTVSATPISRTVIGHDPFDAAQQTLYVGFSEGGLFRSVDDGASWSQISLALTASTPDNTPTALAFGSPGNVFVGTVNGNVFHVSGDTVNALTTSDPLRQVNGIAVARDGNTVIVGHADGVIESATAPGTDLTTVNAFLPGISVTGLAFTIDGTTLSGSITGSLYAVTATGTASGGSVLRSSDFGENFTDVTTAVPADTSDYFFVGQRPGDGTTLYVLGKSSGFFTRTFGAP